MNGTEIISVRERPEAADEVIAYFRKIWASPESEMVYEDCIRSCLKAKSALPQWYVMRLDGRIIACAGLITNDFISRMDLCPWLCALYVEPEFRGNALGARLMERVKRDAAQLGFGKLYLCTDHIGYYEKYGFRHIGTGYHPWGESSRIYETDTDIDI